MCKAVTCSTCGKPSWEGCGAHVEAVLGHVAVEDRCPRDHDDATSAKGGLFRKLLGS